MAQIKLNATLGLEGTLPAISGANLTSLNASNISSGTLNSARFSGGKVLQVVQTHLTTTTQTTGSSVIDLLTSSAITPASASNYFLMIASINYDIQGYSATTTPVAHFFLNQADNTEINDIQIKDRLDANTRGHDSTCSMVAYFSPNTTSATQPKIRYKSDGSGQIRAYGQNTFSRGTTLTIMEIAA